ncbi:hypothetical protein M427DRAFT_134046 [Gonapodya prolifera JEL478]|uniref:Uncharacterized protein n=1 Tax=Gonapodya prolifera (strain JEL478) TaxID=1344416 RepID=A0A139AI37_GONPJ|nr:hypothetical protein M427DRAFT_134046 [Gonapodya prolifera JEL478]|eukprot:KXS16398.1 hypothetical protein M427DRAFT_134046 [Gonapodya prolifera JEL478]
MYPDDSRLPFPLPIAVAYPLPSSLTPLSTCKPPRITPPVPSPGTPTRGPTPTPSLPLSPRSAVLSGGSGGGPTSSPAPPCL